MIAISILLLCVTALAFVWSPSIPLALGAFGYYVYFFFGEILGFGSTSATALFWVSVNIVSAMAFYWKRGFGVIGYSGWIFALIYLFLAWSGINWVTVGNVNPYGAKKLGFLMFMSILPFTMTIFMADRASSRTFVYQASFFSFLLSVASAFAFLAFEARGGLARFTFIESWTPILSATISGIGIIFLMWYLFEKPSSVIRVVAVSVGGILSVVAMYLTGSRGPILSLLLSIVVMPPVAVGLFNWKRYVPVLGIVVLLVLGFAANVNEAAKERFVSAISNRTRSQFVSDTISLREQRYAKILERATAQRAVGIGLGHAEGGYAHNAILEVFEETGVLGAASLVAIMGFGAFCAMRRRSSAIEASDGSDPQLFWSSLYAYVVLESMFSGTIYGNTMFWVSLGMVVNYKGFPR